jgi:hypothetical protein
MVTVNSARQGTTSVVPLTQTETPASAAEVSRHEESRANSCERDFPQGLKPLFLRPLSAWLKPCPDESTLLDSHNSTADICFENLAEDFDIEEE